MTFDEAMRAAKRGLRVSPMGKSFFVYFIKDAESFQRVSVVGYEWTTTEFSPTPYEMMMTWKIYDKNSPWKKFLDLIERAITPKNKLSSNPA